MKSRVEHADLGNAGHQLVDGLDTGHIGGVVEGCKVVALAHFLLDGIVDEHRRAEFFATVHKAVTNSVDLTKVGKNTFGGVGQLTQNGLDGATVVGHTEFDNALRAVGTFKFKKTVGEADFFDTTLGEGCFGVSFDEFVFYRAASAVKNEYYHS